jgi:hypothetical protein
VKDLFPFRIDRLSLMEGEIHYVDRTQDPPIDVAIDELNAELRNLTNSEDISGTLVSTIDATGKVEGTGGLTLASQLDPYAEQPTFDANLVVDDVQLPQFNNNKLFDRYGRFDVEEGTVDVNLECAAEAGKVTGYVKPVLHDVKIVKAEEVEHQNPLQSGWELVVGVAKDVLNNREAEQLATRIPFSGSVSDPKIGIWPAVIEVLRNAFVEAIYNGLDNSITLADVEGGVATGDIAKPGDEERKAEKREERKEEKDEDPAKKERKEAREERRARDDEEQQPDRN